MEAPMTIKQYVSQMRRIPGGRFTMGRTYEIEDKSWFYKDEVPAHPEDVSTFRLGSTPVTVGMWREYLRANVSLSMPKPPAWYWIDDHPMVNVSWNDIMGEDGNGGYVAWASRVADVNLSLPTEVQWEYAAKGASRNLKFPWGDDFDRSKVWCSKKFGDAGQTAPVIRNDRIHVNQFGISDMAGNVYEFCGNAYVPYSPDNLDRLGYPLGLAESGALRSGSFKGTLRVKRGGSWGDSEPIHLRCAYRPWSFAFKKDYMSGFRLVEGPK
jgi:sulfatase modifying factor 1